MRKIFGSRGFTSMNRHHSRHGMPDNEVYEADLVSHGIDKDVTGTSRNDLGFGVLRSANLETEEYSVDAATLGIGLHHDGTNLECIFKYDEGATEPIYLLWDNSPYERVTLVADTESENTLFVASVGKKALLFDGTTNRVYEKESDGDRIVRSQGPLVGEGDADGANYQEGWNLTSFDDANDKTIGAVSAAAPAAVGVTAHGYTTGDRILITGLSDMTELNNKVFTITRSTDDAFTLDETDTSHHSGADVSGGTSYKNSCGVTGTYQYRVTHVVILEDGTEIESSAALMTDGNRSGTEIFCTPAAVTDRIAIAYPRIRATEDRDAYTNEYGDWSFRIRIYRTKSNGAEFYLHTEITSSVTASTCGEFFDTLSDDELGAVLLWDYNSHGSPPASTMGCVAGQRCFVNDTSNPRRVYFSQYESVDYFDPYDYEEFPEDVEALVSWGKSVAVFGKRTLHLYSNTDGIGQKERLDVAVGVNGPKAAITTPFGMMWANPDGVWLYTGGPTARRISEKLGAMDFGTWSSNWQIAYDGNKFVILGLAAGYLILYMVGGEPYWLTSADTLLDISGSMAARQIWADATMAAAYGIHSLETNSTFTNVAQITTKDYGDGIHPLLPKYVILELGAITGGSITNLDIVTENGTVNLSHPVATADAVIREPVPDGTWGRNVRVVIKGRFCLKGLWIVCEVGRQAYS